MSTEAAIIETIKWIRESIRPVVVLLIVSALALFLPHLWLTDIGIEDWLQKFRPWAILFFAVSLVWLCTFPIEKQYHHQKRRRYLRQLTNQERDVLKVFILDAKKTQSFAMNLATARHLVQQYLLIETSTTDLRGHHVFAMDSWVFSYLKEHPELVGIHKNSN